MTLSNTVSSRPVCATKRVEVQCSVVETLPGIRKALDSILGTGKKEEGGEERKWNACKHLRYQRPKALFLAIPTTPSAALALSGGGPDGSYGCVSEWAGLQSV